MNSEQIDLVLKKVKRRLKPKQRMPLSQLSLFFIDISENELEKILLNSNEFVVLDKMVSYYESNEIEGEVSIELIKQKLEVLKSEEQFKEAQRQFSNQMAFKQVSIQLNRKKYPEYYLFLNHIEEFIAENFSKQQTLAPEKIGHFLPFQDAMLLYRLITCVGSQNIEYSIDFNNVLINEKSEAIKDKLDNLLDNEEINYTRLDDRTRDIIKDFLYRQRLVFLAVGEVYEYIQKNGRKRNKLTVQEKVLDIILNAQEPVSLEDISLSTLLSSQKIIKIIEKSNDIIEVEKDTYLPISCFALDESILSKWKQQLDSILDKYYDYCNIRLLFKKLRIYLKKYKIDNEFTLFNILAKSFKDHYHFTYPHIVRDLSYINFSSKDFPTLIINKDKVININMTMNILKELEASENMKNLAVKEIRDNYLQISTEDFIQYNQLKVSPENVIEIQNIVASDISDKPYLVLKNASLHLLPTIDFEWTEVLLKEVINKYMSDKFKVLEIEKDVNYQYRIPVLLSKKSPLSSFEDLILYIIQNEYTRIDKMNISDIEDFLRYEKEVIWNSLPHDIKMSNRLSIDDYGRVSIKKEEL